MVHTFLRSERFGFKKEDRTTFARPACPDGRLGGMVENLATPEQLGRSGRLFGQVVLKPGEAICQPCAPR